MSCVLPTAVASKLNQYQYTAASDLVEYATPTQHTVLGVPAASNRELSEHRKQYEKEDREMFSKLEMPRVRYDVEVVAKLIVYCGWSIRDVLVVLFTVTDSEKVSRGSPLKEIPFYLSTLDLGSNSRGRPEEAFHI